tara:strand:+ start:113 stop:1012 length:900 start_codon:yes stop_codon:yes gene_type:complete
MKVLVITGDKNFGPGHTRFDIQATNIEKLIAVFWGRGSIMPKLPKEHFDVVTSQDPFWRGLFGWFTARRLGVKFNVQVHTDLSAQSFFYRILARFVLRRADSIRVVSEKLKEQVLSIGIKRQIFVLPVFIDLSKFYNIIRRPHPTPMILWLGRFEEEKNPLEAISILKKVREADIDAHLVMLGKGSMTEKVIKKANNLPTIKVLAWDNPIIHFETADVVLCTSWYEGWGASIVEALSAGIPVVAPDVGVAKEAGANVVPRDMLADKVSDVLRSGAKGELKLHLIEDPRKWGQVWAKSLS